VCRFQATSIFARIASVRRRRSSDASVTASSVGPASITATSGRSAGTESTSAFACSGSARSWEETVTSAPRSARAVAVSPPPSPTSSR
jgi:hypothetical protein